MLLNMTQLSRMHDKAGSRRCCRAKHADPRFPVGKARLEAVGVILCACLMTLSSFEVIRSSGEDIWAGIVEGASNLRAVRHAVNANASCQ